jgi:hypothetical protein
VRERVSKRERERDIEIEREIERERERARVCVCACACAQVPDARPAMAAYGPDPDIYYYTGPEYDFQRVQDRHDDRRADPAYPASVRGYGDAVVWLDAGDAGPGRRVGSGDAMPAAAAAARAMEGTELWGAAAVPREGWDRWSGPRPRRVM